MNPQSGEFFTYHNTPDASIVDIMAMHFYKDSGMVSNVVEISSSVYLV